MGGSSPEPDGMPEEMEGRLRNLREAAEFDGLRRKYNSLAGLEVFPESEMNFPKTDTEGNAVRNTGASTECARGLRTECAAAQALEERTARVGIINDQAHGLVPVNTYDVSDFVKKLDAGGKVRVTVDLDGPAADAKEVGGLLAEAAGTRTREGRMVEADFVVAGFKPGQMTFDFFWR